MKIKINKKEILMVFILFMSLFSTAVVLGNPGQSNSNNDKTQDKPVRVKIYATGEEKRNLQNKLGTRHDFGDVFTTTVTQNKYENLKQKGVDIAKVVKYHTLHHRSWHDGGPSKEDISVSWQNPQDGDTVSGTITIQIDASDPDGDSEINTVEWKVGDNTYQNTTYNSDSGYWEDSWDTTQISDGDYTLTAKTTDGQGDSKTSSISVTVDNSDSSSSTRVSDQTPYGIEQIYNDSTISSTTGGSGIDVAVLDTGVDTDHPDLINRIEQCVDFTSGGPFQTNIKTGECEDKNGHGTHTSGTVLADAGSDNEGIYGVAPESDLYAYKVLDNSGGGYADDIAVAIDYAAQNGAEVVSMSFGGDSQSDLIAGEIKEHDNKVVFVASAGNSGPNLDTMGYPGANNNTIGVAAINESYGVPDFSSRGVDNTSFYEKDRFIEVSAGGVDVLSTWNDGGYNKASGTSMSAPHISGLAAKLWSSGLADSDNDGTTTPVEVRNYIQDRASKNANDITKGKHAREEYDPSGGIGIPRLK